MNYLSAFRLLLGVFYLVLPSLLFTQTNIFGFSIVDEGRDTFYRPLDSYNPKCVLRLVNTDPQTSPGGVLVAVSVVQYPSVSHGLALFPNGANLAQIAAGDTTWVSCWTRGLWEETGVPLGTVPQPFTLNFKFSNSQINAYNYQRTVYVATLPPNAVVPAGSLAIAGTVQLASGAPGTISVAFGTAHAQQPVNSLTPLGNGAYHFSTSLDPSFAPNRHWFVKISGPALRDTLVAVNPYSASDLFIEIPEQGPTPVLPSYQLLVPPVYTGNGFWRGAVSESEGSVALFPGQENWPLAGNCPDPALLSACKLYKYDYTSGQLLWEHSPGWQTWGGDMSADGQYVAYLYETGHMGACSTPQPTLRLLDGQTGQILWEKSGTPEVEGKELKISNNGAMLCVGTQSGRVVLYDVPAGNVLWKLPVDADFMNKASFGQVRRILFSSDDQYVYVGSGDNYLRKIRTSDGQEMWRCFVWGWPFVNGLSFSPDEAYIAVGTKSGDMNWVRCADGHRMWSFETGNFEDAVCSPDGLRVAAFSGFTFDTQTGLPFARTETATSAFSADGSILYRLPAQLHMYTPNGDVLGQTDVPGISLAQIPGSQSQWSFLSSDGRYAVVAARDMGVNGGALPAQGILFYKAESSGNANPWVPQTAGWSAMPNPFQSEIRIEYPAGTDAIHALLRNTLGVVVAEGDGELNGLAALPAGMYTLEVYAGALYLGAKRVAKY